MISHPSGPGMPRSHLPFSPVVRHGDLLFLSGQASVDGEGKIVDDDFEGQMRRAIGNLKTILEASGSDLQHVLNTRNYVRDAADLTTFNRLYREYFAAPYPARTTITNCLSGALRYEIECVAVVANGA